MVKAVFQNRILGGFPSERIAKIPEKLEICCSAMTIATMVLTCKNLEVTGTAKVLETIVTMVLTPHINQISESMHRYKSTITIATMV